MLKLHSHKKQLVALLAIGLSLILNLIVMTPPANAVGAVLVPAAPHTTGSLHRTGSLSSYRRAVWYRAHPSARRAALRAVYRKSAGRTSKYGKRLAQLKRRHRILAAKPAPKPIPPQRFFNLLASKVLTSEVTYKRYSGPLTINIIDANLASGGVSARPVLASSSFNYLAQVKNEATRSRAIAAVNANYFKSNGTPLGTLIVDNEWISGSLYDRVSMGFTQCGYVRMDRVDLHGILKTSNPNLPTLWINNLNQPRMHGAKLVMYTDRWGPSVQLAYDGCLLAVDHEGRIIDKQAKRIAIPAGGYVLSDSKDSAISALKISDVVSLQWCPRPGTWADVVEAVSGGPILVKNGQLYVDLKDESFRKSWTSSRITARTAIGVTGNNHLLLVTVEGPHTLWDMAKFMRRLGAVDAMNLDGGGSTTMVVEGKIVTRNAAHYQRRVASALAIVPTSAAEEYRTAVVSPWLMNARDASNAPKFGIEQAAVARP